jgi:nucleoside-diphosphate-sugar epimerase/putative sterol carrier protein
VSAAKKKRIAVTGGSGLLGGHVLKRLVADRSVGEVISIDLRPPTVVSPKLKSVIADVRAPELAQHLQGCDAVVHLAFLVTQLRPRAEMQDVNVEGSKNVFRAAVAAGCTQIVYTSSIAAYGVVPGHPVPIVEETRRRHQPEFAYSACKFEVEQFLDGFEREHPAIAITRLRPGVVIGAYMDHALGDALRRRVIPDNGDNKMPLVWDEDVAEAVALAVQKGARGAFNLQAEPSATAAELARAAHLRLVKIPRRLAMGFARLSPVLERLHVARAVDPAWLEHTGVTMMMSSEKARTQLGWKPKCPTAVDVVKKYADTVPHRLDRRIDVFMRLVQLASRRAHVPDEAARMNMRVHLQLTGPTGGDLAIHFDRGHLTITREVPRPPTAVVTMRATTFLDLLTGRADFSTVGFTGRVRVEGEGLAYLMFQGIVSMFRSQTEAAGPAGFASRQLKRWFEKGVAA